MSPDTTHAERKILSRAVEHYDNMRAREYTDFQARHTTVRYYARLSRNDYVTCAERLADALARRAADRLKQGEHHEKRTNEQ